MPLLSDTIHLDMLHASHRKEEPGKLGIYGLQWGDPEASGPLKFIRDRYILPYIDFDHTAVEIGPGGGRWTRYLLGFRYIYAVDYHQELLDELQKNFKTPNLRIIKNSGTNFPDIPDNSVDFVFSFGVFVHLELDIIRDYLQSLYTIVTNTANIVIQYSDKTKEAARRNSGFGNNTPSDMRHLVAETGYTILEENVTALPHSAIMRFRKKPF
jgi:ubiquinone/menaquinone biosynthesis C-methylase UbiE